MSSGDQETRTRILEATSRLLEQHRGQGVRMSDVAKAAGLSRQAVYLHFGSRANLLVETARYGDVVRHLDQRLARYVAATTGVERLEAFIEFWGNYIPEIHGMARALLAMRDTDPAAAAAWDDRMGAVRSACVDTIAALDGDGMLAAPWSRDQASDLLWTLLAIRNWELLTIECGWPIAQYISQMQQLAKRAFVRDTPGDPSPGPPDLPGQSCQDCPGT